MGTESLVSCFLAKHSWYRFLMGRFLNGRTQLYPRASDVAWRATRAHAAPARIQGAQRPAPTSHV
eukprot:3423631-Prymnesium_polylepis.1